MASENQPNEDDQSGSVTDTMEDVLSRAGAITGRSPEEMRRVLLDPNWTGLEERTLSRVSTAGERQTLNDLSRMLHDLCQNPRARSSSRPSSSSSSSSSPSSAHRFSSSHDYLTEIEYNDLPTFKDIPVSLSSSLKHLRRFVSESDSQQGCQALTTLLKILDSILMSPKDPTKRRIRLANPTFHSRIGQFTEPMEFLLAARFQICEPNLDMPVAYITHLVICRENIASMMVERQIQVPALSIAGFNPYKPIMSMANSNLSALLQPGPVNRLFEARVAENKAVTVEIEQTQEKLKTGNHAPSGPLNPLVFHHATLPRLDESIGNANRPEEEPVSLSKDDLICNETSGVGITRDDINRVKETLGEGPKFKSRAKEQLRQLQRKKLYKKCILRVVFPDRLVLQLEFTPDTKMSEVNVAIEQCLDSKLSGYDWHIFQSPPPTQFNPKKSIFDESLCPGAVVYFKIESPDPPDPPYIAPHLLTPILEPTSTSSLMLQSPPSATAWSSSVLSAETKSGPVCRRKRDEPTTLPIGDEPTAPFHEEHHPTGPKED